jgi:integrase
VDARERFVVAAKEGRALNKHGRRYKPRAIDNIDEVLRVHVEPRLGRRRVTDVRRGDVQEIVDALAPDLSGSRVRAVVNSLRALYRWAQDRDLAQHDPAQRVRLPAMGAKPVERVASPAEFATLLAALTLEDALPYALAGYGMGRRQQVVLLRWQEVDLTAGAIEWGVEWEAAKCAASRRVVPSVQPLHGMLRRAFIAQDAVTERLECALHATRGRRCCRASGWRSGRASAGRRLGFGRSRCRSVGTRRPPDWTPPASPQRCPRC